MLIWMQVAIAQPRLSGDSVRWLIRVPALKWRPVDGSG